MLKIKNLLFAFVLISFASCSSDSDDMAISDLVGTWAASESDAGISIDVTATFKADYSGSIVYVITFDGASETQTESFTWSTDGNQLTLTIGGEAETATYSISGDKLTISDVDGDTVFTRQ